MQAHVKALEKSLRCCSISFFISWVLGGSLFNKDTDTRRRLTMTDLPVKSLMYLS